MINIIFACTKLSRLIDFIYVLGTASATQKKFFGLKYITHKTFFEKYQPCSKSLKLFISMFIIHLCIEEKYSYMSKEEKTRFMRWRNFFVSFCPKLPHVRSYPVLRYEIYTSKIRSYTFIIWQKIIHSKKSKKLLKWL